jgi:SAM-dependent methyltransferase
MSGFDFAKLLHNWSLITPPLRPNREVVAAIERCIGVCNGPALLLGVTPEFAGLATRTVAADINAAMVRGLWLGGAGSRSAIVTDWRRMAFAPESFSLCLGDGSFTLVRFPDELALLFAEIARVLRANARVVCRVFACPEIPESRAELRDAAMAGRIKSFDTLKWRLGMMLAPGSRDFNVSLRDILDTFNTMFPDRDDLVRATKWDRERIQALDANYASANSFFAFASRQRLMDVASASFLNIRFVPSGTYELAECCPLMVMERR